MHLYFLLIMSFSALDTMWLPVNNGQVVDNKLRSAVESDRVGVEILFDKDPIVYSCSNGKVSSISKRGDWGNLIIIKCEDLTYGYMQVDSVLVKDNDIVKKGQPIGQNEMKSPVSSIVFVVYKEGQKQNALKFVSYKE